MESGAWFSYKGERLGQGRENSKQTLKDDASMFARINNDVRAALGLPVLATAEAPADAVEEKAEKASSKK